MAACCCKSDKTNRIAVSCLGRCDLPKHKCLDREDVYPGPVPKKMGWLYTAKDAPEHQLRCGWRPGHIACPVLRRIEQHNCSRCGECSSCCPITKPPCFKPCGAQPPKCATVCPSTGCSSSPCNQPLIRVIRHCGQYTIMTKPSNITNHPSGPYPLKYVLNTPDGVRDDDKTKFSVEAKFNDYHFDYTSSTSSFVLDFSPPEPKCGKPCPKRSSVCFTCQQADYSIGGQTQSQQQGGSHRQSGQYRDEIPPSQETAPSHQGPPEPKPTSKKDEKKKDEKKKDEKKKDEKKK